MDGALGTNTLSNPSSLVLDSTQATLYMSTYQHQVAHGAVAWLAEQYVACMQAVPACAAGRMGLWLLLTFANMHCR